MSDAAFAFGEVDLTNCDREPIHVPASIQPHGAMLVLRGPELRVVQAGGDTARLLGVPAAALAGTAAELCLSSDALARLRALLAPGAPLVRPIHAFRMTAAADGTPVDGVVHESTGHVLVELDPEQEAAPADAIALVQTMMQRVQRADTVRGVCQAVAEEVRGATGFDRVMVYRFLPDGSGAVEAESCSAGTESFLGLHYPASDIPQQARALYLQNWIRLIPDARYTPAPLLAAADADPGPPLDLSQSMLRSVSPIHREYLGNMGVVASMSLSVILHGRLWGLVACHHPTPRYLSYRLRVGCELFAQMASSRIESKAGTEELGSRLHARQVHEELVNRMSAEAELAEGLTRYRPNLLDYIHADGVGLWLDGTCTALGVMPSPAQVADLVAWLNENTTDGVFHTDCLALLYPPARAFAEVASGLVALSVSRSPRDYVLWFRAEVLRTVTWAGNPDKPVEIEADGARLSPRRSFAAWQQAVRLHARPWSAADIEAAQSLRVSLMDVVLRRIDQVARERERTRVVQDRLLAERDRGLEKWQAVAGELRLEAERRAVAESELSQVLRRTVADQEAERQRIARELHDRLGQSLTLLQLGLDGIGRTVPASTEVQRHVETLKGLTDDVGREVNRLAWEIRPIALDDLGLQTAIRHLAESWAERSGLAFDLHLALQDRRLSAAVESALYRVLQEAITNVVRHAGARRVGVILEASDAQVRLIVEDDGVGFHWAAGPGEMPGRRLGLIGMRERLSLVDGALEVESAPGHGTTLFVRVPL